MANFRELKADHLRFMGLQTVKGNHIEYFPHEYYAVYHKNKIKANDRIINVYFNIITGYDAFLDRNVLTWCGSGLYINSEMVAQPFESQILNASGAHIMTYKRKHPIDDFAGNTMIEYRFNCETPDPASFIYTSIDFEFLSEDKLPRATIWDRYGRK